jgi:hypothetical protein
MGDNEDMIDIRKITTRILHAQSIIKEVWSPLGPTKSQLYGIVILFVIICMFCILDGVDILQRPTL